MSLEDKFTELQLQMTTQQTAVINALEAIIDALGGVPPTPTVTLADLLGALEDMSTAQAAQSTALLSSVDLIGTNLEVFSNNSSLNAQRIIGALYATFCACETESPLLAPPIDVTPTVLVDEDKCRRIQFYLSVFGNWLNQIANYGASGAAITGGTLATLLNSVIASAGIVATGAEVGAVAGPPGIVIGAAVALITIAVFTFGGSVLIDYANQFNDPTLRNNMVMAMYAATNADEGYTAFKTTLLAGMDNIPAEVIYTLWWSAWSNDVYSGSPEVDDSAFDGSICVEDVGDCFVVASTTYVGHEYVQFHTIAGFEGVLGTEDLYSLDNSFHFSGELISGSTLVRFVSYDLGGAFVADVEFPGESLPAPGRVYVTSADDLPFTVRVCIIP